jgi:lipopolysaccharide biosynthesis glycosyltransferase
MAEVAIHSLLRNGGDGRLLKIFALGERLSHRKLERFRRIQDHHAQAEIWAGNGDFRRLKGCRHGRWKQAGNLRLLFPEMELFSGYDRLLYLDCDVFIREAIGELLDLDLGGHSLAALPEREWPKSNSKKTGKRLHLPVAENYFNSGVMVMNLAQLRRRGLVEQWLSLLKDGTKNLQYYDQDVLNITCNEDFLALDSRWNFTFPAAQLEKSKIIHFLSNRKPWKYWKWKNGAAALYRKFVCQFCGLRLQMLFFSKYLKFFDHWMGLRPVFRLIKNQVRQTLRRRKGN